MLSADAKDDYLVQNLAHVKRFISELEAKEAVRAGDGDRARDYDGLEADLRGLIKGKIAKSWNWKGAREGSGAPACVATCSRCATRCAKI